MTRRDHPMTGRDRMRPEPSITVPVTDHQPSAWSRDLYYGGGLVLMAFVLALGFSVVRPTPRRRPPEVPALAWARRQARRG
jgi:hypothetical protein